MVDLKVSVLELWGKEETVRTKKTFENGMMPAASVSETVRTVLMKGNVFIGNDDCVC